MFVEDAINDGARRWQKYILEPILRGIWALYTLFPAPEAMAALSSQRPQSSGSENDIPIRQLVFGLQQRKTLASPTSFVQNALFLINCSYCS